MTAAEPFALIALAAAVMVGWVIWRLLTRPERGAL